MGAKKKINKDEKEKIDPAEHRNFCWTHYPTKGSEEIDKQKEVDQELIE